LNLIEAIVRAGRQAAANPWVKTWQSFPPVVFFAISAPRLRGVNAILIFRT